MTLKKQVFVAEYLVDLDGKRAAIAAGYSPKSAGVKASQLLAEPAIQRLVGRARDHLIEKFEIKKEDVLRELLFCVQRDIGDLVDAEGVAITNIKLLPERLRKAIDGFEQEVTEHTDADGAVTRVIKNKFRLVPKAAALDMCMKHLGIYSAQKLDVSGEVTHRVDWDSYLDRPVKPANVIDLPALPGVNVGEDPAQRAMRKAQEKHPSHFPETSKGGSNGNGKNGHVTYSNDELGEPVE